MAQQIAMLFRMVSALAWQTVPKIVENSIQIKTSKKEHTRRRRLSSSSLGKSRPGTPAISRRLNVSSKNPKHKFGGFHQ
jgi:hypothetical protein